MKKFYLLCAAAMLSAATATAGIKVLYSQDFEGVKQASEAGWTYGGASMEIMSDEFGSFLQLNQGATNGRNAQVIWGTDIYGENASQLEDGKYTVTFDFWPRQSSNNQYNSGVTLLSNLTPPANQGFLNRWTWLKDAEGNAIEDINLYQGYLFDLTQEKRETEETASIQWKVNGNADNLIIMNSDWYTITLVVDVNARTVDYEIADLMGGILTSGQRTVPATECDGTEISMYASSLWVMVARYQTQFCLDNMKISCESSQDVANDPSVALTGLGVDENGELSLNLRTYTITFMEGETLVVKGTDGTETEVSYYDCNGSYKYTTTTSGTLVAYTVVGTAKSNEISVEVDATPCALPAASADIISVSEGFGKTYKLTVDNTTTPLSPTIFIAYEFTPNDGGEVLAKEELGTGATVTVPSAGTLKVTTSAFGYQSTTVTEVNDKEYEIKKAWDFARLTDEEIAANGFTKDEDLVSATTSGEQNWTARKRLFYYDVNDIIETNEDGSPKYRACFPFGYSVTESPDSVMHRSIKDPDAMAAAGGQVMEGVVAFPGAEEGTFLQAKMIHRVGLIQDATTNNYNAVKFAGVGENDIIVVNTINGYGSNSCHPVCSTAEEFYAQLCGEDAAFVVGSLGTDALGKKDAGAWKVVEEDGTCTICFNLYRIDTALVYAKVYGSKGGTAIETVGAEKTTNAPIFNLNGVRVNKMEKGIYIQGGKKLIVK